jgi:hypothetical protein
VGGYGWENEIGTLLADVRYAARRLVGNPGLSTISVLALALGIGATTAIFSVIESVLWKPLPYAQGSSGLPARLRAGPRWPPRPRPSPPLLILHMLNAHLHQMARGFGEFPFDEHGLH